MKRVARTTAIRWKDRKSSYVKKFAFFDIDGTLTDENVWEYFLSAPEIAPRKRAVLVHFAPTFAARKLGMVDEPSFREAWIRQMARLLRGWQQERVDVLLDRIAFEQMRSSFRADMSARLREHVERGDRVVLISGMFAGLAERFAHLLGAETGLGTRLAFTDGVCAGQIEGRACAGEQKLAVMRSFAGTQALTEASAYADSFSDVPMLSAVANPVAAHPDDALRAHARAHGWPILDGQPAAE